MVDGPCPPVLAEVVRDSVVESVHRGYAAVVGAGDDLLLAVGGDPVVFARSAVKPFQVLAVLDLLEASGPDLPPRGIAVACASHMGTDEQVIEVAHLLALAGLDETALQCPPAYPTDHAALRRAGGPERIACNCSGKHAAFLCAQVAAGEDPAAYLDVDSAVQRRVAGRLAQLAGHELAGPGVDGCGAPAWRLPLSALARAFARLATATTGPLGAVAAAMRAHPELVGGPGAHDTELMRADSRLVAKRGAEALFGAGGADLPGGALGVAVKVEDGGARAAGPVAAALLRGRGARIPEALVAPPVLGGGGPRGALAVRVPATA